MSGHGYFSTSDGPLNRSQRFPDGYPYTSNVISIVDFLDDDEEDDDEFDADDYDDAVRISHSTLDRTSANDAFGMHARDRRSYVDGSSFGLPNVSPFAEVRRRPVREMSSMIRLRPRSSEPKGTRPLHPEPIGGGTIYGWSSPPIKRDQPSAVDLKKFRLSDFVKSDEEQFEEDFDTPEEIDEVLLRGFIRVVMRTGV